MPDDNEAQLENVEEPSEDERLLAELDAPVVEPKGALYDRPLRKHVIEPILIGLVCLGVSLVFWFSPHYSDFLWASRDAIFKSGEYWRLLTSLFAHADGLHLLSNLPLLLIFGWLLRSHFGLLSFPIAGVLDGVLSNALTLYFYPGPVRLIGASGMVYGAVAMWLTFYMKYEVRHRFRAKLLRTVGVFMVLLFPTVYEPTTSYLAHAFGFAFGIVVALLLIVAGIYNRPSPD